MTPYIPQQLVRQLRELLSEKRVIFVHPNFKAQHLVFDQLLNDAVYVRFQGQELDAAQLREQFDSALRPITGKAKLDGKVAYAILDESDRATPKALIQILNEILGEMDNGR